MTPLSVNKLYKLISEKENCVLKASGEYKISLIENFYAFTGKGITFYNGSDVNVLKKWEGSKSGLIVASIEFKDKLRSGPFLLVEKPRMTFVYLTTALLTKKGKAKIHPTAIIDPHAKIGSNTEIGPYSVIGKCKIGKNCKIGGQSLIADNVEIKDGVTLFSNCIIGEPGLGSVVGYNGEQIIFPHIGGVIIHKNVVIGAGTHVNCGTLGNTVIGENTHISTNCLIAHNCSVGNDVYIAATAKIAGSTKISDKCYIGFGVLVSDRVELAEGITVGIGSTIIKSYLEKNVTLMNQPQIKNIGKLFSNKTI